MKGNDERQSKGVTDRTPTFWVQRMREQTAKQERKRIRKENAKKKKKKKKREKKMKDL
mgnify:CR=1 FL=1